MPDIRDGPATALVSILSEPECWQLLSSVPVGRLVTCVENRPEIFPVNFAVLGRKVLVRTAQGTKLVSAVINENVLFEADDHASDEGWSVIVKGRARVLHSDEELDAARRARLTPWTAPTKEHYIRIDPLGVTGRRFRFDASLDDARSARPIDD